MAEFPVELIPDADQLFRRINGHHLSPDGIISSAAFDNERMSVNWDKYSDAASTADANSLAVVALNCGACKSLGQAVEHRPVSPGEPFGPNQAHAEVCGNKTKAVKRKLRDIAQLVWRRS